MDGPNERFDALLPPEMAAKAAQIGVKKAHLDLVSMFVLGFCRFDRSTGGS